MSTYPSPAKDKIHCCLFGLVTVRIWSPFMNMFVGLPSQFRFHSDWFCHFDARSRCRAGGRCSFFRWNKQLPHLTQPSQPKQAHSLWIKRHWWSISLELQPVNSAIIRLPTRFPLSSPLEQLSLHFTRMMLHSFLTVTECIAPMFQASKSISLVVTICPPTNGKWSLRRCPCSGFRPYGLFCLLYMFWLHHFTPDETYC